MGGAARPETAKVAQTRTRTRDNDSIVGVWNVGVEDGCR